MIKNQLFEIHQGLPMNLLFLNSPRHAKKAARYLARLAPGYFARKLRNPVFIIGSGRSGTTLLINTLAVHDDIATYPGEANDLWHPQTYPWRDSKHRDFLPPIWVDPEEFTHLSLKYRTRSQVKTVRSVFGAYQFLMGRKCFLNKSAMITFMIPFILKEFPDARFVHLIRDGRAVALSYAKKGYKKNQANLNLYKRHGLDYPFKEILKACARSWKLHIEEVERQKRELQLEDKGIIYEIRYEEFCANPHNYLYNIAKIMGIDPNGFKERSYSHISSTNYKYKEDQDEDDIREISQIMEHILKEKGYGI